MDRYVTVTQGEVFYVTEALAQVEGIERGPAGNTSLAAAISIAKEMDEDQIIVVQETEYTGAGKHPMPQLTFAKQNGIEIRRGNPTENIPGQNIVIPWNMGDIQSNDLDLDRLKNNFIKNAVANNKLEEIEEEDILYLTEEVNKDRDFVVKRLEELGVKITNKEIV